MDNIGEKIYSLTISFCIILLLIFGVFTFFSWNSIYGILIFIVLIIVLLLLMYYYEEKVQDKINQFFMNNNKYLKLSKFFTILLVIFIVLMLFLALDRYNSILLDTWFANDMTYDKLCIKAIFVLGTVYISQLLYYIVLFFIFNKDFDRTKSSIFEHSVFLFIFTFIIIITPIISSKLLYIRESFANFLN